MDDEVKCAVCGDETYELILCYDHFLSYHQWKKECYGLDSTNRVEEYVASTYADTD